jgi:hypothetical protein
MSFPIPGPDSPIEYRAEAIRRIILERVRQRVQVRLTGMAKGQLEHVSEDALYTMEHNLLAEATADLVLEVSYPQNWWQHFRQRWLPKRWLAKHPVKMTRERKRAKRYANVCPHHNEPSTGPHLEFLTWGRDEDRYTELVHAAEERDALLKDREELLREIAARKQYTDQLLERGA